MLPLKHYRGDERDEEHDDRADLLIEARDRGAERGLLDQGLIYRGLARLEFFAGLI